MVEAATSRSTSTVRAAAAGQQLNMRPRKRSPIWSACICCWP